MFFSTSLAVLALAGSACATVFVTAPVASSTFAAGTNNTISWMDDGNKPTLQDFGPAKVSIYVGNAQQQTPLQLITGSIDVSTASSIIFTPDPTIGPNGDEYFVRFESLSLKDAAQPQFPALAFSAKYTMTGMTGTFSAAIQQQIDGQSTAPLSGPTSAPASASSTGTPASTTSKASSTAASSTKASTSATPSAHNSALGHKAGWAGIFIGAAVGIAMF